MKLYSAWYCPFAQRVWMSLLYKQIQFDYIEIDPYHETAEWYALSNGTGQVPVITVDNENIVDSTQIMTRLDMIFPETVTLFSINTEKYSKQTQWIMHINNKIVPYFYRYLKSHIEGKEKIENEQTLREGLLDFANAIDDDGPFFSGESISAVDFSIFPFAYRIKLLLGHYRNFVLPETGKGWERYQRWYNSMLARHESKKAALDTPDYEQRLIEIYLPYSEGGGQTDVTEIV